MKSQENAGIKVDIYIDWHGDKQLWEALEDEDKKKIGTALNDVALRAVGYLPARESMSEN